MAVCKICSRPIENGKYCKRCKLQKQARFVEMIEKGGQTIKAVAPFVVAGVGSLIVSALSEKGSSSDDTT